MFKLFRNVCKPQAPSLSPEAREIAEVKDSVLYSPVTGTVKDLKDVPDPAFSSGALGKGVAIEPTDSCIYSPVNGRVEALFPTGHAIGIVAQNGANIIIHIGIDTVELGGEGFEPLVSAGGAVSVGDPLIKIDLPCIRKSHSATVMIVVEKESGFDLTSLAKDSVTAGEPLIEMEGLE